ncbi:hypothetical protein ACFX11_029261 [Malus domestica]
MGGELRYEIAQNAYIKLVLHALKHKTSAVNGILLGRVSPHNDVVEITDSVPLFHSHIGLLPQLEISLILIEEHFAAKGVSIVGYFHANERFDDHELGGIAKNVGDHIYRYLPQAAILLLDNRKLEALSKTKDRSPVVQLYTKDASRTWKLVGSDGNQLTIKEPSANVVLLDYISTEKWQDVVDFDDHLDDISKDWLNPELFKPTLQKRRKTVKLNYLLKSLNAFNGHLPPSSSSEPHHRLSHSPKAYSNRPPPQICLPIRAQTTPRPPHQNELFPHILPSLSNRLDLFTQPQLLLRPETLDTPDTEAWNSCLKAFAEGNDPIEAGLLFNQLQSFRVSPDSSTLSFVLKACTRLLDVSIGRVVHGYVEKLGFRSNLFLMNMILNLYTLCGGEILCPGIYW